MLSKFERPSAKTIVSAAASAAATAMVIRSAARKFIPAELRRYLISKFPLLLTALTNDVTISIDEFDGLNRNQLFSAAELYISTIAGPSTKRLRASLPEKEEQIHVSLGGNEETTDRFRGCHLKWRLVVFKSTQKRRERGSTGKSETRYLELSFHKKHKNTVVDEYLPYVLERSKAVKEEKKALKLHMLKSARSVIGNPWVSVNLDHPANFEKLAMDDEMKSMIMDDLDRFVKRRELYRKVGKAWKRGYLLFGPPGTGKSSLVAAMANYLRFDVYDLELTSIWSNSDLRRLLVSTANRSIVVVEDIDASIDLSKRKGTQQAPATMTAHSKPKVTLSGLLNYIDGLWSSCGDERIIIFTTNHKDKLDPALLRPGRMDLHIQMSYCTPHGFKLLATNYLGTITEHNNSLVTEAELLIASTEVTPAEVGGYLLKSDDPETALKGLIKFLHLKKETERENSAAIGLKSGTNGLDRLKRLLKRANATSEEMNEKIFKKDEAANALKVLIKFLEKEIGTGKTKAPSSSSVATGLESGKENGIKSN